jgi:glycosyltransferase involved in cell wall biosynthesis
MRVLQIISGFAVEGPLGGIERFGIELVQHLPPDIEPILCGMWDYDTPSDRQWLEYLRQQGIHAFCAAPWAGESPYRSFRAALDGAKQALQGEKIDVIHSHCQFGDPLAMALRGSVGARHLVRTVHNEKEWIRRPERRWLFSSGIAVQAFRHEMGVSQQVVDTLNRRPLARLLNKRALLCYNAVNVSRFAVPPPPEFVSAYRDTLGIPPHATVIGSVGRLEVQKGYEFLISAMPTIVASHPDTHLVIAGDGSLAYALQHQATISSVASQIHLIGPQSRIERLYGLLDLFVSPSLWEGLPTVLLESMAAGVPIVATDVSGSRELVQSGQTGWLAPAGSASTLAAAVIEALGDASLRRTYAEQAKTILPRFDIRTAADFHARLYRTL